jgi:hypothetical protein
LQPVAAHAISLVERALIADFEFTGLNLTQI